MSTATLREIEEWKLDAKLEDNERYFYHTSELAALQTGARCYVVGRKGTGKTAIAEHLHRPTSYNTFTHKLTFKNYPFNELLELRNDRFTPPNQYITLWKFVIFSTVLRLMSTDQSVDNKVRLELEKMFPADPLIALAKRVKSWKDLSLKFAFLGAETSLGASQHVEDNEATWTDRVDDMEKVIRQYADKSSYIITFDELDEGFTPGPAVNQRLEYTQLISGLFKAVQDVKARFPARSDGGLFPIVFLRDDIYNVLRDPDKTKWGDLRIDLRWDTREIKNLLGFRLSRAHSPAAEIQSFGYAWDSVVAGGMKFENIVKRTFRRPRDFIAFLQMAAKLAVEERRPSIDQYAFDGIAEPFSRHIRQELEDEIESTLPAIREVLDALGTIRFRSFLFKDFEVAYQQAVARGKLPASDPEEVLALLFQFSVVGHMGNLQHPDVFRFVDQYAQLHVAEPLTVHGSLWAVLRLKNRPKAWVDKHRVPY